MPNVVVYIGAEDARRIAEQGHDLKRHVRDIVRLALQEEAKQPAPEPVVQDEHFKGPDPK